MQNRCQHTHDPQVIAPGAIEEVVNAYARHGIDLIIDPVHRDLPHSQVLAEFGRQLSDISDFCEGGSLASGNAGAGKYSESFDDLKAAFFHTEQSEDHVVHYAIFGTTPPTTPLRMLAPALLPASSRLPPVLAPVVLRSLMGTSCWPISQPWQFYGDARKRNPAQECRTNGPQRGRHIHA